MVALWAAHGKGKMMRGGGHGGTALAAGDAVEVGCSRQGCSGVGAAVVPAVDGWLDGEGHTEVGTAAEGVLLVCRRGQPWRGMVLAAVDEGEGD